MAATATAVAGRRSSHEDWRRPDLESCRLVARPGADDAQTAQARRDLSKVDVCQLVPGDDVARALGGKLAQTRPFNPKDAHLQPDGVRIAYGKLGNGPLLIKAGNPLNHLEYDRHSPIWRHWCTGLTEHYTFVRYDERGCGLSDWNVADFSMDAWVGDLETVADQFNTQRFALLGVSQGASVAIAYAVRHPERVSHLILYGGYSRGRFNRNPTPEQLEEARTLIHLIRVGWGQDNSAFRQVFANLLMPDGTPEQINSFAELARVSAAAENAALMEMAFFNINVTLFQGILRCGKRKISKEQSLTPKTSFQASGPQKRS